MMQDHDGSSERERVGYISGFLYSQFFFTNSQFWNQVFPKQCFLPICMCIKTLTADADMEHQTLCRQNGCRNLGTKYCGACRESCYCSIKCQKGDWRLHSIWCNKMPTELIPAIEVRNVHVRVEKSLKAYRDEGNFLKSAPAMEKLLAFLEYQFGTKIPGEPYRMRGNIQFDDRALLNLRLSLADVYNRIRNFEKALAHTLEAHKILMTRTAEYKGDEDFLLYRAESLLGSIYFSTNDYPKAKHSAELAVAIARRLSAVGQTTYLYKALKLLSNVIRPRSARREALTISEEAYELVSGVHGPEHPDVQDAALQLIDCLILNGDISLADDYARVNYETLMSGSDPESNNSAAAMRQLAHIWTEKPSDPTEDPEIGEEAERLIDRAIEIGMRKFTRDSPYLTVYLDTKCRVSMRICHITNETRNDLESILRTFLSYPGAFSLLTYNALFCLGEFYLRIGPFYGQVEFEIATMLLFWSDAMSKWLTHFAGNENKKRILEKPAKLFKECITEFLDNGYSTTMCEKTRAATTEYKIWETTLLSMTSDQPLI